jgi:hypothetical protein
VPTAVHAVADGHDTPYKASKRLGLGVDSIAQLVPFKRSATVNESPNVSVEYPTAVHAVLDVHDAPNRKLPVAWVGTGVGESAQLAPFHRSASVTSTIPPLLVSVPTSVHAVADAHDTPNSSLDFEPLGFGLG